MDKSSSVREATLRLYQCMSSGDARGMERLFSHQLGVMGIGTDPNEWWAGHETVVRMFATQMQEMGGKMVVEAGDLAALAEGTVGWVADRPMFRTPDGAAMPCRITAVFRQEDGDWKIVQMHASVGVSNVEVVGKELTTK